MRYTIATSSITHEVAPVEALTVSSKGWVVIPADLRRKYDLRPGSRVMVVDYGGVLAIVPAMENPVEQAAGMLKGGSSLTAALLEEHARELENEL
jgi:AbrB family looped-hinge helix DNA binding protein